MSSRHDKLDLWALDDLRPGKDFEIRWPAGARELLLRILRDERAAEDAVYTAARVLCRMPVDCAAKIMPVKHNDRRA